MQGFTRLDDAQLSRLAPWLRVGPAVCLLWTGAGTALGSAAALWALLPFAALGAVLPTHPFDVPYNRWLRFALDAPPIPSYGAPRRFACAIATVWLAATALAFQSGATTLGALLGTTFLLGPTVNVTTGFCIPSWIFGKLFGLPTVCPAAPGGGGELRIAESSQTGYRYHPRPMTQTRPRGLDDRRARRLPSAAKARASRVGEGRR